ncbi:distal tail protein Dit [Enterococcus asini]|uniref:distal tail protein Dit n=1 Tax=Enterococcus asini TaxID=57732 RepID=UPI0015F757EE|nr:distal tail protein Dit [Enterococcus asini]
MKQVQVTYAGYDLTEYLVVTSLNRGLLPEVEHDHRKIGLSDGYEHFSTSIGSKKIKMEFFLSDEVISKRRKLSEILMKREPLPLIFSDEPEIVWYAVPDGDTDFSDERRYGTGTIDWIIPDGVSHNINSIFFTNVVVDAGIGNMVLDSNFDKKNKYWKQWAKLLNEKYNGSDILRGDFSTPSASTNDPTFGNWFQVNGSTTRYLPGLTLGDKVSFGAAFRVMQVSNQPDTIKLILEERSQIGGSLLKRHAVTAKSVTVGEWQVLKAEGVTISDSRTKALNLALGVYDGGIADISKPQWNLGANLNPYTVATAELSGTIAVSNSGSYRAAPIIRCRMNGENGLVALVNSDGGLLQFGNPNEIDIKQGMRSDKVIDIGMRNNEDKFEVNAGVTTYPNYLDNPKNPNLMQGSWDWNKSPEAATPIFVNGSITAWGGPTLHCAVPRNSANENTGDFKWVNRFGFDTNVGRAGRFEFVAQSDDAVGMSLVVRDSSATTNELYLEGWFQKTRLFNKKLDRNKFKGTFYEAELSRDGAAITYRLSLVGKLSGETVTAAVSEIQSFTMAEAENLPITSITGWPQRFGNTNHVLMEWTDTKFTWINTPTATNVPNTFDDGDLLEIDVATPKVMLNGVEVTHLHALGNEWDKFWIEPGNETIQPIASDWANMFECEIELKEAYI